MKFVAIKTADQLDLQALHRVQERLVRQRTAIINQIRAFLLERGIAVRPGYRFLRATLIRLGIRGFNPKLKKALPAPPASALRAALYRESRLVLRYTAAQCHVLTFLMHANARLLPLRRLWSRILPRNLPRDLALVPMPGPFKSFGTGGFKFLPAMDADEWY